MQNILRLRRWQGYFLGLLLLGLTSACTEQPDPAMAQINQFIKEKAIDKTQPGWKLKLPKPPELKFTQDKSYIWQIVTNKGTLQIELLADVAPMHVSSTIYLATLGFYDDLIFHRVIKGFMAQGGDPVGNGTGGPGYFYPGEFSDKVLHDKPGLLSMANRGPNTDGSQFFITFVPTPHLNFKHSIFGRVTQGMDVLKQLENSGSNSGKTTEELKMLKTSILVKPI